MAGISKKDAERLFRISSGLSDVAMFVRQNRFPRCRVDIYPLLDEEAYKLWEKAAAGMKVLRAKKHYKKKTEEQPDAPAE